MKIGIDATGFAVTTAGTVVYLTEILARWNADPRLDHRFYIFVCPKAIHHLEALQLDHRFMLIQAPDARHWRLPWQQLVLPWKIGRLGLDVHWGASFTLPLLAQVPMVVTVHDMTFELFAQHHERLKRLYFPAMIRAGVRRARRVLAISATTREDLRQRVPASTAKTTVTLLAARTLRATVTASASPPPPLHTPYVLFVGTLEPRKNLDRLLQAWRSLPLAVRQGWRLRIIGATGWMVKPPGADPADREEGIELLGHLDDAALSAQLQQAALLAYPSIYEGFGLPVIEAMQMGVPVLTSNVGATREVAQDAARLVDPASVAASAHGKYIRLKLDTIAEAEPEDLGWRVYED